MQPEVNVAKIVPGFRGLRIDVDGTPEAVDGSIHPPLAKARASQIGVCGIHIGIFGQRLLKARRCPGGLSVFLQQQAQIVVRLREVRAQ